MQLYTLYDISIAHHIIYIIFIYLYSHKTTLFYSPIYGSEKKKITQTTLLQRDCNWTKLTNMSLQWDPHQYNNRSHQQQKKPPRNMQHCPIQTHVIHANPNSTLTIHLILMWRTQHIWNRQKTCYKKFENKCRLILPSNLTNYSSLDIGTV